MSVRVILIAAVVSAFATTTTAQNTGNPFRSGTTLSGFGGGTFDSEGAAPAAGLEVGWEITRHVAVEGTTLWSLPGDGQHDFGVMIGPKFNLSAGRPAVPYLTLGVGMYRASFDSLASPLPPFYADRVTPAERIEKGGTFDDFLASVGGGAELFVHSHWAIRPDVRLLMVTGDSKVRWITTVGAHLAYHFERHRITDSPHR